jgi:hypothetical protein
LLILPLQRFAAMTFNPFGKWVVVVGGEGARHLSLNVGRDAAEIRGEMPHLNNYKSV